MERDWYRHEHWDTNVEFLPDGSPQSQLLACQKSLENLWSYYYYHYYYEGQLANINKARQRSLLSLRESIAQILSTTPTSHLAQRVIETTAAFLDSFLLDEITATRSYGMIAPGKSSYYREFPFGRFTPDFNVKHLGLTRGAIYFLTIEETQQAIVKLLESQQVIPVPNLQELRAVLERGEVNRPFVLLRPITHGEIVALEKVKIRIPYVYVCAPFLLNTEIGGLILLDETPSLSERLRPYSNLPRKEIWKAILKKGQPLFAAEKQYPLPWPVTDKRKSALLLPQKESGGNLGEKHQEHYRRLLPEHPFLGKPLVVLTRSGVSANETAIAGVASLLGKEKNSRPPAFVFPGWYYENKPSINASFPVTEDPRKAKVFFVNHEPSEAGLDLPPGYETRRQQLLKIIFDLANNDRCSHFFLVFDATTNPFFRSWENAKLLPDNLTIIHTASLTKWQGGKRKYFFGLLGAWGGDETMIFPQKISQARGNLTPLGIENFPLLTPERVRETIAIMRRLGILFTDKFSQLQEEWPQKMRFLTETYIFFTYLLPSLQWVEKFSSPYVCMMEIATVTAKKTRGSKIEVGDSFGLATTRLTNIPIFNPQNPAATIPAAALRISFGFATPPTDMIAYAKNLALEIQTAYRKRIKGGKKET